MFRTNLRIAWRHLVKDRQFTLLNLLGLTAGLACTLLIWLWVTDELSVDRFFAHDDQLYQLMERRTGDGMSGSSDESSGLLGETLKTRMPEIAYATPVAPPEWYQKFTLSAGEKNLKAVGQYAGKDYFNVFSFPLVQGNRNTVLADKNSIVISDELARKLFDRPQDVLGKKIRFQQEMDFFVSGVFRKLPVHSSTQFDFVLSFDHLADSQAWVKSWNATGPHNYVILKKGTDISSFNRRIARVVTENSGDSTRQAFVAKFSDSYLSGAYDHGSRVGGKIYYVRLFSLIAIFILTIACINFVNLSTAKASQRMKEVGIKKVVGAPRGQLVLQFLTESTLLTAVAMLLAIGVAWWLLPQFNQLTGKQMNLVFDRRLFFAVITVTAVTGLLSGSYPAIYLSGFDPIKIVKGKFRPSWAELMSRKGLVVFQFTLSVILIVSVLVVYRQIRFIQRKDPGFNKDNILRFTTEGRIAANKDNFIAQLKKIPGVVNVTYTFNNMVGRNYGTYGLNWEGKAPNTSVYFEGFGIGYDFPETMGMTLTAGRSFSSAFGADTNKILINDAAASVMHLTDPVGRTIQLYGQPRQIIGVIRDFHFESLHEPVKQSFFTLNRDAGAAYKIMARIKSGRERETVERIANFYTAFNPGFPFDYNFLDEAYQQQYESETRVGILSRYFAGLAILISCLGLFGLAAFTAQRRQREIGIRKVVGASVRGITLMLSKEFLQLVLIAILIAFPVSWWAMHQWLQSFAYQVSIGPAVFLLAGSSVVLITIITISFQAVRAALANPVKSLRAE